MVTAPKTWRRWCGPRSELVRATELAADELRAWSGLDSKIEVRLEDRTGLTETRRAADAISDLHADDLRRIKSIVATVEPDREQWWARRRQARDDDEGEPSEPPRAQVQIRVTDYGTSLQVTGDDRTRVEGLRGRLAETLGRAATNSPGVPRWALLMPIGVALGFGALAGPAAARWLGWASRNDRWETAEIVGVIVGTVVPIALCVAAWWMFPPIEMFDEGGAGRARRFRSWMIGTTGALLLVVLGALADQVI